MDADDMGIIKGEASDNGPEVLARMKQLPELRRTEPQTPEL